MCLAFLGRKARCIRENLTPNARTDDPIPDERDRDPLALTQNHYPLWFIKYGHDLRRGAGIIIATRGEESSASLA